MGPSRIWTRLRRGIDRWAGKECPSAMTPTLSLQNPLFGKRRLAYIAKLGSEELRLLNLHPKRIELAQFGWLWGWAALLPDATIWTEFKVQESL